MRIRKPLCTILGILVLPVVALASAQISDEGAREQACDVVRLQLHLRPDQFLSVQRDETLEQLLSSAVGKRGERHLIYKVSQQGDEIKENAVVHHLSTDADLVYIVAVNSADGISYRIHGFPDSIAEFEKLMTAVGMKVSSSEQAESVADLYRAVNPRNMPLAPISSLIELKQAAERQCHGGVNSFDTGQEAFTAWWNRAKPQYAAVSFKQRAVPHGSGYRVEWIVLSSPSGGNCGGAPLRVTLEVSSDGHVGEVSVSPLGKR
jgi:hypothetical protein